MLTVIMGAYFKVFITLPNVFMMYPILVYLIVGLHSHSYDICIKAFMAVNGEEYCQMNNQWWIIVHAIYINIIIVTLLSKYIIDWCSLYRIEYNILNTQPKCLPNLIKSSATKFLWQVTGFSKPSRY